jgi:hypothetical protein
MQPPPYPATRDAFDAQSMRTPVSDDRPRHKAAAKQWVGWHKSNGAELRLVRFSRRFPQVL